MTLLKGDHTQQIWWPSIKGLQHWWMGQRSWHCLPDLGKVFGTFLYDILVPKLERGGFDGWTTWWIRNWLEDYMWRGVVKGPMIMWNIVIVITVTSGTCRGQYWDWCCSASLLFAQTVGLRAASASSLMALSCVMQSCWREGMPSKGTWTSLRCGPVWDSWSSTSPSAKSYTWVRVIPNTRTGWVGREVIESSPEKWTWELWKSQHPKQHGKQSGQQSEGG